MAAATKTPAITTDVWAAGLLKSINAPVTANNVKNLKLWLANEQSPSTWASDFYNPLGVTVGGSVKPFATVNDGITATAQLLLGGNYNNIVTSLRANAPTQVFASAVVNSPWNGSGHYGGLNTFLNHTPLTASATPSSSSPGNEVSRILGDLGLPGGGVIQNISSGAASATNSTLGGLASVGTLAGDLVSPTFWKRVGVFTGGLVLAGVGLALYVSSTKSGKKIITTTAAAAAA